MSLPNYSFIINKLTLDYIGERLGESPKLLYSKAEELDIEEYRLWICDIVKAVMGSKFPKSPLEIDYLLDRFEDYYGYYHSFIRAKHFCVKSFPDEYYSRALSKDALSFGEEVFIDFKYKDINGCIDFYKRKMPFYINDKMVSHSIILYYNREDCYGYNDDGTVIQSAFLCNMHVSEEGRLLGIELCKATKEINNTLYSKEIEYMVPGKVCKVIKSDGSSDMVSMPSKHNTFHATNNLKLKQNDLPERDFLFGIINYAIDCYKFRKSITRSNVKMNKHYKQHEVHMSTSKDMRYVPLAQYYKDYEPKPKREWQGGHHASPCEHERRGCFRRTRKHSGSYDLVNGEFVKVEDGTGEYTVVKPTHVKGRKDKQTVIYKI